MGLGLCGWGRLWEGRNGAGRLEPTVAKETIELELPGGGSVPSRPGNSRRRNGKGHLLGRSYLQIPDAPDAMSSGSSWQRAKVIGRVPAEPRAAQFGSGCGAGRLYTGNRHGPRLGRSVRLLLHVCSSRHAARHGRISHETRAASHERRCSYSAPKMRGHGVPGITRETSHPLCGFSMNMEENNNKLSGIKQHNFPYSSGGLESKI